MPRRNETVQIEKFLKHADELEKNKFYSIHYLSIVDVIAEELLQT